MSDRQLKNKLGAGRREWTRNIILKISGTRWMDLVCNTDLMIKTRIVSCFRHHSRTDQTLHRRRHPLFSRKQPEFHDSQKSRWSTEGCWCTKTKRKDFHTHIFLPTTRDKRIRPWFGELLVVCRPRDICNEICANHVKRHEFAPGADKTPLTNDRSDNWNRK